MDAQKVDMFLMVNGKYFEGYMLPQIRERLLALDDSKFIYLQSLNLKDPTIALVISIVAGGHLGIDRFYIGDVGLGIAKLLTCGGLGIWTIVDWFLIMGRAREVNFEKLQQFLM
jgi:TM2 domain-containing membrane protein YozV